MSDPYRGETIANWVSDFCASATFEELPAPAKEYAEQVLPVFVERACAVRDVPPADLEEGDLKPALIDGVGALALPGPVRVVAPALCAAFLAEMEAQGRLGGGRTLALYVRALRSAFEERAGGVTKPIRNPGSRIGRNDPCPCGSGRKYKQCCMKRELG